MKIYLQNKNDEIYFSIVKKNKLFVNGCLLVVNGFLVIVVGRVVESGVELLDVTGSFISSSSEPNIYPLPMPISSTAVDDSGTGEEEDSLGAISTSIGLFVVISSSDMFVKSFNDANEMNDYYKISSCYWL